MDFPKLKTKERKYMPIIVKGAFRLTEKLNLWLELKGWSQRDLAREIGCDESLISQWSHTRHPKAISSSYLRKLCLVTGLDVGDLITFDRNLEQED